jgi:hypothetical protein
MNSKIERGTRRKVKPHRAGVVRQKENGRIVVTTDGEVTSLSYRGQDPSTRYLPREQSVWTRIKDAFMMG